MDYKHSLQKYNGQKTRFTCPGCGGKHQFSRYIDNATGEYLSDDVGKCNRNDKCGYHKTPKQHFANPTRSKKETPVKQEVKKLDLIPREMMQKTLTNAHIRQHNFAKYLIQLFGVDLACVILVMYNVGRSKEGGGTATTFWQEDANREVRTGKTMFYDSASGKRIKDPQFLPRFVHRSSIFPQPFNFQQCFFGENLLTRFPNKKVCIVESEKSAIISSIYMPQFNWLATGGVSGVKWREHAVHKVLDGRDVTLIPDFGFTDKAKGITCYDRWSEIAELISKSIKCRINVSRLLEDNLKEEDRVHGYDLVDFLVRTDTNTGLAINDAGVPIIDTIAPMVEWLKKYF